MAMPAWARDIAPVPYRGTTALMPDMLANRITMSFANIVNVVPLAREGKLRALSITSIKRSVLAPDVPTARRVAPPDDRLRIANKASGHLAIGDNKAPLRKPRGIRLTPSSRCIRDKLFPKRG
jgi:hypothetical protein